MFVTAAILELETLLKPHIPNEDQRATVAEAVCRYAVELGKAEEEPEGAAIRLVRGVAAHGVDGRDAVRIVGKLLEVGRRAERNKTDAQRAIEALEAGQGREVA